MVAKGFNHAITRRILALHFAIADAMPPAPTHSSQTADSSRIDHKPQSILLIGGSVRAAAVDASQSGYDIVAMDHFGDADLLAVCKRWIHLPRTDAWPDLVTDPNATIVPTGGFDWPTAGHPPGDAKAPGDAKVAFPRKHQFDAMRNPKVLAELAIECGIRFPITIDRSAVASYIQGAHPNHLRCDHQSWLIKPFAGTGGLAIRTPASFETSPINEQLHADEYLQQRIVGRPIGVNFLSRFRDGKYETRMLGIFAGLTHHKNPDHRWLYGGSIGPLELPFSNLITLGECIARRFELVGLVNVDLMLTPDRSLVMLEINPRYSASMELLPNSGCLIDCHVAAYEERAGTLNQQQADHRFSSLDDCDERTSNRISCKRIIYAIKPMRFNRSISQLYDLIDDLVAPLPIDVTFHDLPANDDTIPSGYPVMTVIARCPISHPRSNPRSNTDETMPEIKMLVRQTHRIAARIRKSLR